MVTKKSLLHERWRHILAASMVLNFVGACGSGQESVSTVKLTRSQSSTLWTANQNKIPVCWDTIGYDREKDIVKNSVTMTWQYHANVDFTGWGFCNIDGPLKQVRMRISPQDTTNSGAGGSARVGMAALSTWGDNNPGVNFSFNPDGTAVRSRVEYVAVHEFGHVLGFLHEQDAPGNVEGPAQCATSGVDPDASSINGYDRDSIMNYCNRDGNMTGNLTDMDIEGVQRLYGVRRANTAPENSCNSAPSAGRVTLAAPWNDAGNMTLAVFSNDGTKFAGYSQWATRQGGWGDSVKWNSGDFNGDGKTDIGAVWNNGGSNVLTIRKSTGSGFVPEHWSLNVGGWMDSTKWFAGDFNGDGRADMAGVWNDGGKVSIAVYPSDGSKFLYPKQWMVRDGGWIDDAKWMVGDFNGDGRADIAAAWNNAGRTTLTVRLSKAGDTFSQVHWSLDAGRWSKSSSFIAGDYNGDGRTDIAELWNDIGSNSIKVSIANAFSFQGPRDFSLRDGGWGSGIKWIPGDFNGDGKTDIAAAWNYGGENVLTVRSSSGSGFTPAHWSLHAGGWMDSTAWCSGKY